LRRKKFKDETFGGPGMKKHRKVKNAFDLSDQADSQLKA
jgi:tetratricopeptide (TPR) repeat protein